MRVVLQTKKLIAPVPTFVEQMRYLKEGDALLQILRVAIRDHEKSFWIVADRRRPIIGRPFNICTDLIEENEIKNVDLDQLATYLVNSIRRTSMGIKIAEMYANSMQIKKQLQLKPL